jgi:hypothetical protein
VSISAKMFISMEHAYTDELKDGSGLFSPEGNDPELL